MGFAVDLDVICAWGDGEEDCGFDSCGDVEGRVYARSLFFEIDGEKAVGRGLATACPVEVDEVGA